MTLGELERWLLERGWGQNRKLEVAQHLTLCAGLGSGFTRLALVKGAVVGGESACPTIGAKSREM